MLMHDPPHPGAFIRRQCLEPLGLTVTEAARGLSVSRNTLSMLLNGRIGISPEMAIRLSQAFGGSPETWLQQQLQYDLWHAHQGPRGGACPPLRLRLTARDNWNSAGLADASRSTQPPVPLQAPNIIDATGDPRSTRSPILKGSHAGAKRHDRERRLHTAHGAVHDCRRDVSG